MNDWTRFPVLVLQRWVPLWKVHQRTHSPEWFGSDGTGRFDPLPSHRDRFGTCYLAAQRLGGYVEVFGRIAVVPRSEVDKRAISELTLVRDVTLADLTDRSVLGNYGVTAAH